MNYRKTPLVTGEHYHTFNRGVAGSPTFLDKKDFEQAIASFSYYRYREPPLKFSRFKELSLNEKNSLLEQIKNKDKLIEILGYVLMPNHFHFLLKQNTEKGISEFLSKFTNSYSKYFNTKYKRAGPLFQGVFKSVYVETAEQLIHLSRYIHLNPLTSFIVTEKNFLSYQWSSLGDFLKGDSALINPESVLSEFSSSEKYLEFVMNQKDYQRKLKEIEHLTIES